MSFPKEIEVTAAREIEVSVAFNQRIRRDLIIISLLQLESIRNVLRRSACRRILAQTFHSLLSRSIICDRTPARLRVSLIIRD